MAKTECPLVIMVEEKMHYLSDWVKGSDQESPEKVVSVLELLQVQESKKVWEKAHLAEVLVVMMG